MMGLPRVLLVLLAGVVGLAAAEELVAAVAAAQAAREAASALLSAKDRRAPETPPPAPVVVAVDNEALSLRIDAAVSADMPMRDCKNHTLEEALALAHNFAAILNVGLDDLYAPGEGRVTPPPPDFEGVGPVFLKAAEDALRDAACAEALRLRGPAASLARPALRTEGDVVRAGGSTTSRRSGAATSGAWASSCRRSRSSARTSLRCSTARRPPRPVAGISLPMGVSLRTSERNMDTDPWTKDEDEEVRICEGGV